MYFLNFVLKRGWRFIDLNCSLRMVKGKRQIFSLMLTLANDFNFSSSFYQIKESYYVIISHSNTTMTNRLADQMFFIGAMDINKAFSSVSVVRFDPVQPENTGGNEIIFPIPVRGIGGRHPAAKDGLQRLVATDFLIDTKTTEWRLEAPGRLTEAETRGRNGELMNDPSIVEKLQRLRFCIDPDLVAAHFLSKVSRR
jgi:hypothetical protein